MSEEKEYKAPRYKTPPLEEDVPKIIIPRQEKDRPAPPAQVHDAGGSSGSSAPAGGSSATAESAASAPGGAAHGAPGAAPHGAPEGSHSASESEPLKHLGQHHHDPHAAAIGHHEPHHHQPDDERLTRIYEAAERRAFRAASADAQDTLISRRASTILDRLQTPASEQYSALKHYLPVIKSPAEREAAINDFKRTCPDTFAALATPHQSPAHQPTHAPSRVSSADRER